MVTKKPQQRLGFKTGEYIVYPAHGVGLITSIEEQEVAGLTLELFVISFEQDKLTLRVPVAKIKSVGMRKLAEEDEVKKALETVTGRAQDRKSTRLNSSHVEISYAVFCLKKKKKTKIKKRKEKE